MKTLVIFTSLLLLTVANLAFGLTGEYIPRSYYVIDHNGHRSDVVYFRSKRDIEEFPIFRIRRSSSSASAHASASASSSSSSGGGGGGNGFYGNNDFIPSPDNFQIPNIFGRLGELSGNNGGGGGQAFSTSGSFGNGHGSGTGYSSNGGHGGGGGGSSGGYNGPILFSRFGEDVGSGIHASGSAQGPNGAFSSTSTSSKDGKVTYSVQSGKY